MSSHPHLSADEVAAERFALASDLADPAETLEGHLRAEVPMLMTRRAYLAARAGLMTGAPWWLCVEAADSVALAHVGEPGWDLGEQRSWADWEALSVR